MSPIKSHQVTHLHFYNPVEYSRQNTGPRTDGPITFPNVAGLASPVLRSPRLRAVDAGPGAHESNLPDPSSRSSTCRNNNCASTEVLLNMVPKFHFISPPVGVGWGARSAAGFVEDNMIRGAKPSLDFKRVNLSKLYAGANYINFPQQPNTYFISISHKRRGPGILFGKALIAK